MGNLLHYAIMFLVVALVAAFLGFGGVSGTAMEGARILFWVAIVLFVVSAVVRERPDGVRTALTSDSASPRQRRAP